MKVINFFIFNILFLFTVCCINAQPEQQNSKSADFIQERINDNLYVLKAVNYNTNIGVFVGSEELLLIDPMAGDGKQQSLTNAIKLISNKPIKYVLNTHSHGDHSGANSYFSALGATVIAHENSKYSKATSDITFTDSYTIEMGNETIELHHIAAHTFDDALIYFKKNNTIFIGDSYMTNSFPHFYYGGGSKGHVEILNKAIALGDANTTIVPAHGNLKSDKKQLLTFKENSEKWVNRIKTLHTDGKTANVMIEDEQIKKLAQFFTGSEKVWTQTIEKTISVDFIPSILLSKDILNGYEGMYTFENGQTCEVIFEK
ncbi:MBL fold metallo-hydrolase, partial [Fulvivirga sp. RKSG066]|uniref:MBL fold metallo-hydrolase n=1 Tax=Fulvivirga aurantia TaxID=2529383 RepID=UPI0012BC8C8F